MMKLEDYFKIVSTADNVFRFEFKGFFTDDIVDTFGDTIKRQYFQAVDSFAGQSFITYVDLRGLKVMPDKAKAMVAELMSYGKERNLFFSININPTAVSRSSIRDAGKLSHSTEIRVIVATPEEAEPILKEKLVEMKNAMSD